MSSWPCLGTFPLKGRQEGVRLKNEIAVSASKGPVRNGLDLSQGGPGRSMYGWA